MLIVLSLIKLQFRFISKSNYRHLLQKLIHKYYRHRWDAWNTYLLYDISLMFIVWYGNWGIAQCPVWILLHPFIFIPVSFLLSFCTFLSLSVWILFPEVWVLWLVPVTSIFHRGIPMAVFRGYVLHRLLLQWTWYSPQKWFL